MDLSLFGLATITVTAWKLVGLGGALCFASRWVVQALHRQSTGSSQMPTLFWALSLVGAAMTTLYFTFGKNDSVGIIQNALPMAVAGYNLWKDVRPRAAPRVEGSGER